MIDRLITRYGNDTLCPANLNEKRPDLAQIPGSKLEAGKHLRAKRSLLTAFHNQRVPCRSFPKKMDRVEACVLDERELLWLF